MKHTCVVLTLVTLSGCSIVKSSKVADDWPTKGSASVKRLAVMVTSSPGGVQKAGEAMTRITKRYVNQKRDFLVKVEVPPGINDPRSACGGDEHIEGVLILTPKFIAEGSGFETEITGALVACSDMSQAWSGTAAGSFPSKDSGLVEVTQVYVQELGPEVQPFIPPMLNLLRPLLDTLPQPHLTDADVEEKLTVD